MSFSYKAATTRPPDQRPPHSRVEDEAAVERRYAIGGELGRGSFGIVREVTSRVTGELLAVKTVNKDKVCLSTVVLCEHSEVYQPLPLSASVHDRIGHVYCICVPDIARTYMHWLYTARKH